MSAARGGFTIKFFDLEGNAEDPSGLIRINIIPVEIKNGLQKLKT